MTYPLGDLCPSLYILKRQSYKQSILFGTISCSPAVHADQHCAPHVFISWRANTSRCLYCVAGLFIGLNRVRHYKSEALCGHEFVATQCLTLVVPDRWLGCRFSIWLQVENLSKFNCLQADAVDKTN